MLTTAATTKKRRGRRKPRYEEVTRNLLLRFRYYMVYSHWPLYLGVPLYNWNRSLSILNVMYAKFM